MSKKMKKYLIISPIYVLLFAASMMSTNVLAMKRSKPESDLAHGGINQLSPLLSLPLEVLDVILRHYSRGDTSWIGLIKNQKKIAFVCKALNQLVSDDSIIDRHLSGFHHAAAKGDIDKIIQLKLVDRVPYSCRQFDQFPQVYAQFYKKTEALNLLKIDQLDDAGRIFLFEYAATIFKKQHPDRSRDEKKLLVQAQIAAEAPFDEDRLRRSSCDPLEVVQLNLTNLIDVGGKLPEWYTWFLVNKSWHIELEKVIKSGGATITDQVFMASVKKESSECMKVLLNAGIDANMRLMDEKTALIHASALGAQACFEELLTCSPNVNAQDRWGMTALMHAAKEGHSDMLAKLLKAGADVNPQDKSGMTALMYAAKKGNSDQIEELIKGKADVNLKDKSGRTALMYAAKEEMTKIIPKLIEAGADVNHQDNGGMTALMHAAKKGNSDEVEELIKGRANVNLKDKSGQTALMYTLIRGWSCSLGYLIKSSADINLQDNNGQTALMIAYEALSVADNRCGDEDSIRDCISQLRAMNANADIRDNNGETASEIAQRLGLDI